MQSFKELREITRVEETHLNQIDEDVAQILNEAFIMDCSEYGIQKYESILGILPEITDSLEDRKARVLIRWNDSLPYTIRTLIEKLNSYCGVNNYDLVLDRLNDYEITIYTHFQLPTAIQELEATLDKMIPLNVHYETFNDLVRDINGTCFGASATVTSIVSTTTTETNKSETITQSMYQSGAIVTNKTIVIS